jgi:hypothetical protein
MHLRICFEAEGSAPRASYSLDLSPAYTPPAQHARRPRVTTRLRRRRQLPRDFHPSSSFSSTTSHSEYSANPAPPTRRTSQSEITTTSWLDLAGMVRGQGWGWGGDEAERMMVSRVAVGSQWGRHGDVPGTACPTVRRSARCLVVALFFHHHHQGTRCSRKCASA